MVYLSIKASNIILNHEVIIRVGRRALVWQIVLLALVSHEALKLAEGESVEFLEVEGEDDGFADGALIVFGAEGHAHLLELFGGELTDVEAEVLDFCERNCDCFWCDVLDSATSFLRSF